MIEKEIRVRSIQKGTTYRYNLDYTTIPVLVENYNPAYLLTSPVLDAVCYETTEGVPDEITVEIYATFCDRDIQRMIKAAEFKKGDGTLRNLAITYKQAF